MGLTRGTGFPIKPTFYWTTMISIVKCIGGFRRATGHELLEWSQLRVAVRERNWWYAENIVHVCMYVEGRLSIWQRVKLLDWIKGLKSRTSPEKDLTLDADGVH